MKTSRIIAMVSMATVTALLVGAGINLSLTTNDIAEVHSSTPAPDPVSTASLDPVVVTAKR